MRIRLPASGWRPRPYQRPLWDYLERGGKRAIGIWHRRAGKDEVCLHRCAIAAHERVGTYWHMLPEAAQARKAIWEAVNPHTGRRRIDEAFPAELRATTREQEMFIRFFNGSTWQVVGSDNFNSLVGSPPVGLTVSEWALAKPSAWAFLRPVLAENGGWAVFITTPRGRNHAWRMYEGAKSDPDWFADRLSAQQTGAISPDVLARELREYIRDYGEEDGTNLFAQEYEVSFDAAIVGSYYSRLITQAEADGRITKVDADPDYPVHTVWDLGKTDDLPIWWFQVIAGQIRVVDYYVNHGHEIEHYAGIIKGKDYPRGTDYVPHDAKAAILGMKRTRIEQMQDHGLRPELVPLHKIADGINAVRRILPICWFDQGRCQDGLEALRSYRREWDEAKRCFRDEPLHDFASHPADAFRYLAMSWREVKNDPPPAEPVPLGQYRPTFDDLIAAQVKREERI